MSCSGLEVLHHFASVLVVTAGRLLARPHFAAVRAVIGGKVQFAGEKSEILKGA